MIEDRRREGFAGVAGDLFSSGESVLVAVADVPRRRAGLEAVVAALAGGPMPVVSWPTLAARPELASGYEHLVALDPPPGGIADPLLNAVPRAHLAWGPAEAEFAIAAYRAALDLRPQLTQLYRALRELPADADRTAFEAALHGPARYPRPAGACARLLTVLTELGLIELDLDAPSCRTVDGIETDLELSPTYRAARAELEATEQALLAGAAAGHASRSHRLAAGVSEAGPGHGRSSARTSTAERVHERDFPGSPATDHERRAHADPTNASALLSRQPGGVPLQRFEQHVAHLHHF